MPADYPAFLSAKTFDAGWAAAGLDDEALFQLQPALGADPELGDVMTDTGGLRKAWFARPGTGKSGGLRVCYAHYPVYGVFLLYVVIQKNVRANLSKAERRQAATKIEAFEKLLAAAKARQDRRNRDGGR